MSKIGLIDVDGHNFPNLALMKLSAYHKSIGDIVEWVLIGNYDKTYMSKVFTYTPDCMPMLSNLGEVIKGGWAYNNNILPNEIEHIMPDYSLYNISDTAYGFLTRGCPNKCSWCLVYGKEGNIRANADIEEFWNGQKKTILLDNNVLTSEYGLKQIEKIVDLGIRIDFNQGLDARIIANNIDIAKLLSKVKWNMYLRMACDTKSQMGYVEKATYLLRKYGAKPKEYFVYVLVKEIGDALERVRFLKKLKLKPFAQPYRDFITNKEPDYELKRFARWVNHRAIFESIDYEQYIDSRSKVKRLMKNNVIL